ncbi:MAG: acetyl-CoA hydrolase, partial [Pseudorhodoplanes sp.]
MNRPAEKPAWFDDAAKLADAIVERVGKTIVLALPLGLGKANHIANALYAKACTDPSVHLTIFTALTLEPPAARSELEQRFLKPFAARIFAGYPALAYANAVHARTLPPNVTVNEFFFEAGHWLGSPYAQQNYISANYTHALHYVLDRGVNVVAQLVAPHESGSAPRFSLSCNPDLTVDLLALRRAGRVDFLFAGETNSELPFIGGDAAVGADEFDMMLDNPALDFPLFAPPREPITLADYAAGLHAATLVPDGGTLQIGIGSLGEAVAQGLVLRHRNNAEFLDLIGRLPRQRLSSSGIHDGPFERGLYACTEMFVESLLDLFHAGVLKREVDGAVLDAGFFVGSRAFYRTLREMAPEIAA